MRGALKHKTALDANNALAQFPSAKDQAFEMWSAIGYVVGNIEHNPKQNNHTNPRDRLIWPGVHHSTYCQDRYGMK